MSRSPATGETFLVIGGCGFLGHNITNALLTRGEKKVHVLDLGPPPAELNLQSKGAQYHTGDMTDLSNLTSILGKIKPNAVFHTASPHPNPKTPVAFLEKVNVKGTKNVIHACNSNNVRKLVYTSSASVVFTGADLKYADERMPYADNSFDPYSDTKAAAERDVLAANTADHDKTGVPATGLRTCAIRPSGIFGPHDRQTVPGWLLRLTTGQTNVILGDGRNLFDFTYVDNVTHAHLLASDRLETRGYDVSLLGEAHLPRIDAVDDGADRGVPTSEARQDVQGATDYARRLPSTLSAEAREETLNERPVVRNKYDQFFHLVHPSIASPGSPIPEYPLTQDYIPVAGEAFFVTNGQPMGFWDMAKGLWREASPRYRSDPKSNRPWKISKDYAMVIGSLSEWYGWITGKETSLTKMRVQFAVAERTFNIEKARRVLGYEPLVGLPQGIKNSVQWWLGTPEGQAFQAAEQGKGVAHAQS